MAAMKDRRHECVAQGLFAMKTPEQASADAGYDNKAKSFASNARKRACRPDIKGRVAELQSCAAACTIIDAAWIRGKVAQIGGFTVEEDKIKASDVIAALALLAKMTPGAMVPTQAELTGKDGVPLVPEYTDADRARALAVFLAKNNQPVAT